MQHTNALCDARILGHIGKPNGTHTLERAQWNAYNGTRRIAACFARGCLVSFRTIVIVVERLHVVLELCIRNMYRNASIGGCCALRIQRRTLRNARHAKALKTTRNGTHTLERARWNAYNGIHLERCLFCMGVL